MINYTLLTWLTGCTIIKQFKMPYEFKIIKRMNIKNKEDAV